MRPRRSQLYFLALPVLVVAVALPARAVSSERVTVPFTRIAHGFFSNPPGTGPVAVVLEDRRTARAFVDRHLIGRERETVLGVDFRSRRAIAVFAGHFPTGGYEITIKQVARGRTAWRIVVELVKPRPGTGVIQAFTQPYDIVAVPRGAHRAPAAWVLTDSHAAVLARGRTGRVASRRLAAGGPLRTVRFQSPSRNMGCISHAATASQRAGIRCDVLSGLRPKPRRRCALDWVGLSMNATGRAGATCAGDTAYDREAPLLAYGRTWKRYGITCSSRRTGLRCTNRSRHGFVLARERWRLF